jgi:solute carrier family 25 aspartate/glutamate transporter 12/13
MAAATAAVVKEAVKESLLGTDEPAAQLSAQTKLRFNNNAVKDPETGELYMGPEEFINAVAPSGEDYVSSAKIPSCCSLSL